MESKPFDHAQLLTETLKRIADEPSVVRTYGTYNAGYFSDGNYGYIRPPRFELTPQETWVVSAAQKCLRQQGSVCIVGIGEMLGFSLVRTAKEFENEIQQGTVEVFATNFEDFDIQQGIFESKRRLRLFGSIQNYRILREIAENGSPDMQILTKNRPIFQDRNEIEFIEAHHHLVTYISQVDTLNLPEILSQIKPGLKANIIHEHMGGFTHSSRKHTVLTAISEMISLDFGVVLTTTRIDSGDYSPGYTTMIESGTLRNLNDRPPGYEVYSTLK